MKYVFRAHVIRSGKKTLTRTSMKQQQKQTSYLSRLKSCLYVGKVLLLLQQMEVDGKHEATNVYRCSFQFKEVQSSRLRFVIAHTIKGVFSLYCYFGGTNAIGSSTHSLMSVTLPSNSLTFSQLHQSSLARKCSSNLIIQSILSITSCLGNLTFFKLAM